MLYYNIMFYIINIITLTLLFTYKSCERRQIHVVFSKEHDHVNMQPIWNRSLSSSRNYFQLRRKKKRCGLLQLRESFCAAGSPRIQYPRFHLSAVTKPRFTNDLFSRIYLLQRVGVIIVNYPR